MIPRSILALCLTVACATADSDPTRVTFSGYHGVTVGMTPAAATAAYGVSLSPATPLSDDERTCYHLFPNGQVGAVAFMVFEGSIVRTEIREPGILTEKNVGVGTLESEVEEAYPIGLVISPHKYDPTGHYLTLNGPGGLQLLFETDGTRVTQYRTGQIPAIGWVEGCL